jgi:hypothetical protein
MDDRSEHSLSVKAVGDRTILGLDPAMVTFRCADCGAVREPGHAPMVKAFLMAEILRCEPRIYDLFLDRSLAPRATGWLRHRGYGSDRAADLIASALELGLLDGERDTPRLGAARCADCYLGRGAAFEARRGREAGL